MQCLYRSPADGIKAVYIQVAQSQQKSPFLFAKGLASVTFWSHLNQPQLSYIKHPALICSLMEALPVQGSIISDHVHIILKLEKCLVQRRLKTTHQLDATHPPLHGSASTLASCLKTLHGQPETKSALRPRL